jgi:pimeloyl-ACP methyl ester carboxylesterase
LSTSDERIEDVVLRHDYAELDQVRLHYVECGAGDELVILLHGFPEFWYSWRHQLPVLGRRYHTVAPDMRGFNLSDKPVGVREYRIELLARDVVNLIRYFGKERAVIISHDWGAAVAWAVAMKYPDVVSRLVAMQVPPPAAWQKNLTLRQLARSWYMLYFQLPWLPEWWARANDFARVDKMFRETTFEQGVFSADDLAAYKDALRQPGALTSSINYYRANVFRSLMRRNVETAEEVDGRIRVPTLFIFAEHDIAIVPETVRGLDRFIDAPYREVRIPNSGHWVQNEAVEEVNRALLKFLEGH